jgi:hypothetical protein
LNESFASIFPDTSRGSSKPAANLNKLTNDVITQFHPLRIDHRGRFRKAKASFK